MMMKKDQIKCFCLLTFFIDHMLEGKQVFTLVLTFIQCSSAIDVGYRENIICINICTI